VLGNCDIYLFSHEYGDVRRFVTESVLLLLDKAYCEQNAAATAYAWCGLVRPWDRKRDAASAAGGFGDETLIRQSADIAHRSHPSGKAMAQAAGGHIEEWQGCRFARCLLVSAACPLRQDFLVGAIRVAAVVSLAEEWIRAN
jgi:hypothetical protein